MDFRELVQSRSTSEMFLHRPPLTQAPMKNSTTPEGSVGHLLPVLNALRARGFRLASNFVGGMETAVVSL